MRVRAFWPAALLLLVLTVPLARGGDAGEPPGPDELRRASCLGAFDVSALDGPRNAQHEDHPSAAGLRRLIRNPGGIGPLGKRGWQLLSRTDERAIYSRKRPPHARMLRLRAQRDESEPWTFESSIGGCDPRRLRDGIGASDWGLRPSIDPIPADTTVKVHVTERGCASGQNPGERVLEPSISYRPDAVAVAYFIEPLGGAQTCPGNPPAKETIELAQPLGERELIDAGTVTDRVRWAP